MSDAEGFVTATEVYDRLMLSVATIDAADRHVLACILSAAHAEADRPLTMALGLDRPTLARLLDTVFPGAYVLDDLVAATDGTGDDAIEEPDFRRLLLNGRRAGAEIEDWLACIVARRSQLPGHLWHGLGFRTRTDLSDMLTRHFPALAARNVRNMRWKKFFYREMCQAEGIHICKSPVCDVCPDFNDCFGADDHTARSG